MITSLNYIIVAVVSYLAGLMSGFFLRTVFSDKKIENNTAVLMVVTMVWAVSMFVDILTPTYETSPLVHGLMGAIVGFFYRPKNKE